MFARIKCWETFSTFFAMFWVSSWLLFAFCAGNSKLQRDFSLIKGKQNCAREKTFQWSDMKSHDPEKKSFKHSHRRHVPCQWCLTRHLRYWFHQSIPEDPIRDINIHEIWFLFSKSITQSIHFVWLLSLPSKYKRESRPRRKMVFISIFVSVRLKSLSRVVVDENLCPKR